MVNLEENNFAMITMQFYGWNIKVPAVILRISGVFSPALSGLPWKSEKYVQYIINVVLHTNTHTDKHIYIERETHKD